MPSLVKGLHYCLIQIDFNFHAHNALENVQVLHNYLLGNWSPSNKQGHCLAPQCQGADVVGDLEHILVDCPALQDTRDRLKKLWLDKSMQSPAFYQMI